MAKDDGISSLRKRKKEKGEKGKEEKSCLRVSAHGRDTRGWKCLRNPREKLLLCNVYGSMDLEAIVMSPRYRRLSIPFSLPTMQMQSRAIFALLWTILGWVSKIEGSESSRKDLWTTSLLERGRRTESTLKSQSPILLTRPDPRNESQSRAAGRPSRLSAEEYIQRQ